VRGQTPEYNLVLARSLRHALQLMNKSSGYHQPFAGGTDIMVHYEAGTLKNRNFVSIFGLKELQSIQANVGEIRIGAGVTYNEIIEHPILSKEFPMLSEAAQLTGAIAIQNRGTLGGNIANASPAADSPPALLAYAARLELTSLSRKRIVEYADFHTGYRTTLLERGELITAVLLPRPSSRGSVHYYRKVGTRRAQAISKVCFAGFLAPKKRVVRIGLGSVGPIPLRLKKTEVFLQGLQKFNHAGLERAQEIARQEISPIDDFRSTASYRSTIVANLLAEFLERTF
jgi:CO/xanthine dehydrogenase FAD-binding subunit